MPQDPFVTDARSTALLGEKVRSQLPGYRITLAPHPAASTTPAGLPAVIVDVSAQVLEVVLWVDARRGVLATALDISVEVRVVFRDPSHRDAIAEVVGDARELSVGDLSDDDGAAVSDVLALADELINEMSATIPDQVDPNFARVREQALYVYANDPFV